MDSSSSGERREGVNELFHHQEAPTSEEKDEEDNHNLRSNSQTPVSVENGRGGGEGEEGAGIKSKEVAAVVAAAAPVEFSSDNNGAGSNSLIDGGGGGGGGGGNNNNSFLSLLDTFSVTEELDGMHSGIIRGILAASSGGGVPSSPPPSSVPPDEEDSNNSSNPPFEDISSNNVKSGSSVSSSRDNNCDLNSPETSKDQQGQQHRYPVNLSSAAVSGFVGYGGSPMGGYGCNCGVESCPYTWAIGNAMQQFQMGVGGGYNPHHPQHHPLPGNGEPPPWSQGYNSSAQQQQQQMYSQEGFPQPQGGPPPHQMGGPQMEMGQPWWSGPPQGMVRAPSPSEMSPGFRMPGGGPPQAPGPWALRGTRPRMDRRGPVRHRMSSRGPDEQSPPSMGPSMSPPLNSQPGGGGSGQTPPFPFGGSDMINDLIPGPSPSGIVRGGKRGPGRPRGGLIPSGVPPSALMDPSLTSPPGPGSAVNAAMSPVMEPTDSLIVSGPIPTTPSGKVKGVNNNKKRYVCEICQKRFSTAWYVRVHRRSHNGERPYLCRNCGKGFMLPNVLQVHLRKCEKNNAPVDVISPEVEQQRQHQSPPLSSPNGPPGMPGGPMSNFPNHPHMGMGVPMGPGEGAGPPPGMNHMPHNFGPGPPMGPGGGNNDLGFNNQRFMSGYNMGGEPGSGHPGYNNAIPPQGGPPMHHSGYDMPSPGPPPHSMGQGGSPSPHPFPQQIPPPAMYSPGGGGGVPNPGNNPPPGGLPGGHPGSGHIPGGGPPPPSTNEHDPSSVHFLANDRPLEKGGGGDGPDNLKDLYCAMCEIQFTDKSQLEDHLKSHRPYSCDVCEKRFSQKCNLITHLRLHTGEKPYPCTFCDKRFTQKGNLDAHHKTHTKEKPYPCNQCGRKFAFKSSMLSHVRQAHGGLISELDDLDDISSIKQQLKYNSQDPGSPNNFSSGIPTPQSSLDSIPSSQGIGHHPGSYHATYQSQPGGMIHHGYPGSMTPSTDSSETSSNAASDISKTLLTSQESTLAIS